MITALLVVIAFALGEIILELRKLRNLISRQA